MSMPRDDLPFCDCRWLERAAHDPDNPIEFDPELNIQPENDTRPLVANLPLPILRWTCARFTPWTDADVSSEETIRLHKLIKDIKTEGDVISSLGEPTYVVDPGTTCTDPDKDGKPGQIHTFKTLRYEALSDTAVVEANIDRDGKAEISFYGKYIGKPPKT